jgi:hypothetical protein
LVGSLSKTETIAGRGIQHLDVAPPIGERALISLSEVADQANRLGLKTLISFGSERHGELESNFKPKSETRSSRPGGFLEKFKMLGAILLR